MTGREPGVHMSSGKRPRPWSLQRAFARLVLIAALLPALVFAGVTLANQHLAERGDQKGRLTTSTRLTAANLDTFIANQVAGVALLADARSGAASDWDADLAHLLQRFPGMLTALVADAEAQVIAARTPEGRPADDLGRVADREYFTIPRRTLRPHVSGPFRGRGMGNDALVAVSAPLLRDGRFDGVVEASILIDTFTGALNDAFVARGYEMLLVDRDQRVIAATAGMGVRFLERVDIERRFAAPRDGAAIYRSRILAGGGGGFVARADMDTGWTEIVVLHQLSVLEGVTARVLILLGVLALITLGVFLAVRWQMRQLNRGTRDLLGALHDFALDARSQPGAELDLPVELRPVAVAIDDLAERLNSAYGGLNEALERQSELAASLRGVVASREQEVIERTEELSAAVAELDRLSRTDALTGCLNVRGLDDWIGSHKPGQSASGQSLALLAMDLDHFKKFNDRYGHPAGDVALKRVVGAARGVLRGEDDAIARIGGEEFLVLLPHTGHDRALEVAGRVCEAVHGAGIPHEDSPAGMLTVSIGVAIAAQGGKQSIRAAINQADQALYRAKDAGRDRVSD